MSDETRTGQTTRKGTPQDAIGDITPRDVITPTTVEQLSDVLGDANQRGDAIVFATNRTKINWGHAPQRLNIIVDLSELPHHIEHAASDLVVRVSASTPLDELQRELALSGQRLAVDSVVPNSSVGGLLATGISGPLRHGFGSVRDLVIGITTVRADGRQAKSGGRVVKNVAGYDLAKLYTGSYGTLGAITEAYFRLHPLPAAMNYILTDLPFDELDHTLADLVRLPLALSAIEVFHDTTTTMVTVGALVEGVPTSVDARSSTIAQHLGPSVSMSNNRPSWWAALPGPMTLKVTSEIGQAATLLRTIAAIAATHGLPLTLTGSAGVGVFYIGVAGPASMDNAKFSSIVDAIREASVQAGGSTIILEAALATQTPLDTWGPIPALSIMRRIKEQFDPCHALAPGRFVGGI